MKLKTHLRKLLSTILLALEGMVIEVQNLNHGRKFARIKLL
jgi:hypothetical protein